MHEDGMSDEELIDVANLGEETRRFIESDVGKSMCARAEQYVLDSLAGLAQADPDKPNEIIRLQERIRLARLFPSWFDEIMNLGEQARMQWTQRNPQGENNE